MLLASLRLGRSNGTFVALSQTRPTFVWYFSRQRNVLRVRTTPHTIAHFPARLCHTCLFSCARDIGNFVVDHTKGHNAVVGYSIPLVTGYTDLG